MSIKWRDRDLVIEGKWAEEIGCLIILGGLLGGAAAVFGLFWLLGLAS